MSVLVFLLGKLRPTQGGDKQVQRLNVSEFYMLGKVLHETEKLIENVDEVTTFSKIMWPLYTARFHVEMLISDPCVLPQASQRAARSLVGAVTDIVPEEIDEAFAVDKDQRVFRYHLGNVTAALKAFETIMRNDMPEMSAYAVAQIGIYRTDDLIERSERQISEPLRTILPPLALSDVKEAGKCLAFGIHTAASFHLSRAIETCINLYYEALTGKPYDGKGAANNWHLKIEALKSNGAEAKITEFLHHIKVQYRNPVTHPDVTVDAGEAFNFFGAALSAVSMILSATETARNKAQPNIPGLEIPDGLYSQLAANALRSDAKEGSLSLSAGDATAA